MFIQGVRPGHIDYLKWVITIQMQNVHRVMQARIISNEQVPPLKTLK